MKILLYTAAAILLGVGIAGSAQRQDRYIIPIRNDIAVVSHNPEVPGDQPVFLAGTGDWLMVLDAKGGMYQVSDLKGHIGWIDKTSVKQRATGEAMTFEDARVLAYLDNPTPVYILDATNPYENSIEVKRSFAPELSVNVDRETIERIVGKTAAGR